MGEEPARSSFSDDGSRIVSKRQQLHVLSSWRKTVRLLGEDQPDRLSQITEAASSPSGSSFIFSHLAGRRLSFGRRTAADRLSHMTESASSLNGNRFIFSHLAGRRFVSGGGQPQPNRLSQIGIGRGGRGGGGPIESGWAEWAGGDGQPVDIGRAKVTVDMILVLSSKRMRKAIPGEEASPVGIPDRGSPEEVFAQDRLCGRQCHRPGRSLLGSENVECSIIGGGACLHSPNALGVSIIGWSGCSECPVGSANSGWARRGSAILECLARLVGVAHLIWVGCGGVGCSECANSERSAPVRGQVLARLVGDLGSV